MEDVAAFEQLEGEEELLAVGAHRLDVQPHVFAVFLQNLSQVHAESRRAVRTRTPRRRSQLWPPSLPKRLKHQTEVLLVVEVPEEAEAVELVVWVGVVQLLEELQLLQTRLLPEHQNRVG